MAAKSSSAGTSVRLTQRRWRSGPARSVTLVTKVRPRCVSRLAHAGSSRSNDRST